MAASQFPYVVDALVTLLKATASLSAVVISDGLPITEDRMNDLVMIGTTGSPDDTRSGTISQEYNDLAGINSTREETVQVSCCVISQTGDVDVAATRTRAFTILGSISDAVRANYTLGVSGVMRVEMSDVEVFVEQFADGTSVRLPFTISVSSLI